MPETAERVPPPGAAARADAAGRRVGIGPFEGDLRLRALRPPEPEPALEGRGRGRLPGLRAAR